MSDELRPCPFCGQPAKYNEIYHDAVNCSNRQCTINSIESNGTDMDRWNTRPLEDAMQKRIAKLEAQVAVLCPIGDLSALKTWRVEKQTYMESIDALEKELAALKAQIQESWPPAESV